MVIKNLTPILWSEKIPESIEFYTQVLGFTCVDKNEEWGWAALSHGEIDIMIAKPNKHFEFKTPNFTGSFYFKIENIEELWENLKNKVEIVYPIEVFEWQMKEFAIYDNNGYILQFGEDIS